MKSMEYESELGSILKGLNLNLFCATLSELSDVIKNDTFRNSLLGIMINIL